MPSLDKLVRYEDKKAEAFMFIDGLIRNSFEVAEKDFGLYKLISYYVKKAVETMYIEEDIDTANYYMSTATTLAFLYDILCPGELINKDINEDERVKKLTNGDTLTDEDYQYLVAFYKTRSIKAGFGKNVSKFDDYEGKMENLAIKWILNPERTEESSS